VILASIVLLVFTVPVAWWLSGHDPGLTGESPRRELIFRATLCAVTVMLVETLVFLPADPGAIPIVLLVAGALFLTWNRCLGELFAGWFTKLIDPEDKREFDPNESARVLDQIAGLLKEGQREEAVQLGEELKKSGDANLLVLETMLARAGIRQKGFKMSRPLVEASRLRTQGKFGEAETMLRSLLAENPANLDAALMLMRLYARELRRGDKAAEVLRSLESQPHIPAAHLEYARRSIHEWGRREFAPSAPAPPESADELLAGGRLGSAIEILERKIKEQPADFDLWLKLAEAHGRHARNFQSAGKIIHQMESSRGFNAEQIQLAKARLKEWREAKPPRR
jgi:tetratricopeptide (TPR) repeat protein